MPKPCPVCGSRKWRRDGVTGNAVCEDGHVFQDFRSENLVMEPMGHALQRRRVGLGGPRRNKRKEEGMANKDFYHGNDAEWLRLQAFQLLLRTQVQVLSKLWSLPSAFEIIVRDLWAYQLSMSRLPTRPESSTAQGSELDATAEEEAVAEEKDKSGSESDQDSESSESGVDPELLDEMSERSSDEEMAEGTSKDSGKRLRTLRISDTLVTLIVALWVVRYPVLNVDLERLVNSNTLPYLDFGRTTAIPAEMKKRINRDTLLALCPLRSPTPLFLHERACHFARRLTSSQDILIPEMNLPPLAWKITYALGGNPRSYAQISRLLAIIDANMTLLSPDISILQRRRRKTTEGGTDGVSKVKYERTSRYEDIWLPEMSVAAAWVIIMKMAYGLDGTERCALLKLDPIMAAPQSGPWIDQLKARLESGAFKGSDADIGPQNFLSMGHDDIGRWLDRCDAVLLAGRELRKAELFPLTQRDEQNLTIAEGGSNLIIPNAVSNSWAAYHSQIAFQRNTQTVDPDLPNYSLPLLPGERIRSYASSDLAGTLPPSYEIVLNSAAEVVGVRPRDMARIVEVYERRLNKLRPTASRNVSRANSLNNRKRRSMG